MIILKCQILKSLMYHAKKLKAPMKKIVHLNFMNSINKNGHPRNRKKRERNKECSEKKKKKKLSDDFANF